uniref:Mitochondrial import inner membrane translocase subunit TIM50 n=1 Tax=Meloidogyne javanica TaxID=6303 RepID=A0A915LLA9_MELJA
MNGTPKRLQFLPPQTRDNFVLRIIKSSFHAIFIWIFNVYNFTMLFVKKQYRKVKKQQFVKYSVIPLSPLTAQRLCFVRRKIMVLDLDETLIHSHHDGLLRSTVKPGTPPDFIIRVTIDNQPVSCWFDLVIFTASMEIYGASVADKLDQGRGILQRRYFRQHCTQDYKDDSQYI